MENIVNSIDELEELYTMNMITYNQYMNMKSKLLENKYTYIFHGKTYIVSMTNDEREKFERLYHTHLEPVEDDDIE